MTTMPSTPVLAIRDLTLEFPTYRGPVKALSGVLSSAASVYTQARLRFTGSTTPGGDLATSHVSISDKASRAYTVPSVRRDGVAADVRSGASPSTTRMAAAAGPDRAAADGSGTDRTGSSTS